MSLASGSRVIWVDPYHSLVLEFEETTWWIMRKSLMSVLLWREVPGTYPLADFPNGLTLAPKGCVPIWRLEFQGGAKQTCGNRLLVGKIS